MKLIKPSNQFSNLVQCAAHGNGYSLLSMIMAVLLFFGANNQSMAASTIPIASNCTADVGAPAISGDQLNAAALLKENAPTVDDQPWTFTQKVEAGITGIAALAALSYGGFKGYKYYQDYQGRLGYGERREGEDHASDLKGTQEMRNRELSAGNDTEGNNALVSSSSPTSGIIDLLLENLKTVCPAWRQQVWDLVTLKVCREGTSDLVEQNPQQENIAPLTVQKHLDHLLAERETATKGDASETTTQESPKSWKKVFGSLFSSNKKSKTSLVEALTTASSEEEMLNALDSKMQEAVQLPLEKYISYQKNDERAKLKFLYYIAKNQDKLTPEKLNILNNALEESSNRFTESSSEICKSLHAEVTMLWNAESNKE